MRRLTTAVMAAVLLGTVAVASADAKVVRFYKTDPPQRVKVVRHFKPDATPSPRKVRKIARLEQKRWGGPSLLGRIFCESGYRWNATNGPYRGLLQFGPIWDSMYGATPRKVRIKRKHWRWQRVYQVRVYASGRKVKWRVGSVHQRVKVVRKGKLPRGASPYHGWAAIRVGQRAVSGDGPSTGWECGL